MKTMARLNMASECARWISGCQWNLWPIPLDHAAIVLPSVSLLLQRLPIFAVPPLQFALLPAYPRECKLSAPPPPPPYPHAPARPALPQSAMPVPQPFPAHPAAHPETSAPASFHPSHIADPQTPPPPREIPPRETLAASPIPPAPPVQHPASTAARPPQRDAASPARSSPASSLHRPRARRKPHSQTSQTSSALPGCRPPASLAAHPCRNSNLLAS